MIHSIDHVVIGVHDLTAAAADFEQAGFRVTPGGEHVSGGTHNALVTFANGSYLELIAFKAGTPNLEHKWGERLAKGEGFLDYALLATDLEAEEERLRQAGIEADGVRPLGRLRPDGRRIDWLLLNPVNTIYPVPFLIDDITPRELRVPVGPEAAHPLGIAGVAGVTVLVRDLALAAPKFAALLGTPGSEATSPIAGVAAARRFGFGSQWIELIHPRSDADELQDHLETRGPAPYEITVIGTGDATPAELLPPASTHGARIRVARG